MKQVFDFYSDAGHGWVKVPKQVLNDLNIADKITSYSYQRGDYAYLEEDLDAGTFLHAYVDKYKTNPRFNNHYSDHSRIRSYECYDGKIMATIYEVK